MSEDTREPTAASGEVADNATSGAALLVIFYGRRKGEQIQDLHTRLYQSLVPEPREDRAPRVWTSPDGTTGLFFDPPGDGPHDTTVLQLALNAPEDACGNTSGAWRELRGKLENVPRPEDLDGMKDIWGYTLVYQAVLNGGSDPEEVLSELLPAVGRLGSSEDLGLMLPFKVPGGWAWLLGIPDRGDGPDAGMICAALASEGQERELINQFYSMSAGSVAELLEPDLIAHKGYHQMRQYRNEYREQRYQQKLGDLRRITDDLLEDLRKSDHLLKDLQKAREDSNERSDRLESLFQLYCRLLTVVSALKGLQVGMLQQLENLDEWRSQGRDNEALEVHQRQLKTATRELELKLEPLQSDLDIADKAVSAARLQLDKEHENRVWQAEIEEARSRQAQEEQRWKEEQEEERERQRQEELRLEEEKEENRYQQLTQTLLTVVATALALPQLIDKDVAGWAIGRIPWLASFEYNTFAEFLAQIFLVGIFGIPILWVVRRWLNKRRKGYREQNQEEAILRYEQALEVYTRADFPVQWAGVQNQLANAYNDRIRGDRTQNLGEAILRYEQALGVYTREKFPVQWATTRNNLAAAIQSAGRERSYVSEDE